MKKELRVIVHNKYSGHCGYCGKEITYKEMQVDHIKPQWKFRIYVDNIWNGLYRDGVNDIENLMPTCSRCNHYKREQDLEGFRNTMLTLHERVSKISTPEPAPTPASRPYQPVFMESMTLPRKQRKGWSPMDNPKYMGSKEKVKIFFTEQPPSPIGLTATIGFFIYGMGHFVSGKTPASNWKYAYYVVVLLYSFVFKHLTNSPHHYEGTKPDVLVAKLLRS